MILTRTYLNVRRQGAKKLLGSPQAMHAAILSGFPPAIDPGRPLWRVDAHDPLRPALYVVSQGRPDLTHLEEQAGWPSQIVTESADYDSFLEKLSAGQRWSFRLTANPTYRATIGGASKVVAHVTVRQQLGWLLQRGEQLGVSFGSEQQPSVQVVGRELRRFSRRGSTVTLASATFVGQLEVQSAADLRRALTEGIGRAKAYGCGLMTLAQP